MFFHKQTFELFNHLVRAGYQLIIQSCTFSRSWFIWTFSTNQNLDRPRNVLRGASKYRLSSSFGNLPFWKHVSDSRSNLRTVDVPFLGCRCWRISYLFSVYSLHDVTSMDHLELIMRIDLMCGSLVSFLLHSLARCILRNRSLCLGFLFSYDGLNTSYYVICKIIEFLLYH